MRRLKFENIGDSTANIIFAGSLPMSSDCMNSGVLHFVRPVMLVRIDLAAYLSQR